MKANQQPTTDQFNVILTRIANRVGVRGIQADQSLWLVLSNEDYDSVKQMLWDEYQLHLEKTDTVRSLAYILQERLNQKLDI